MPGHLSQPYNPHTSSEDARVLTERIIALDTQRLAVFHSCGNDRRIQEYVLDILENPIYQRNQPLPWVMVSPLLQPVKYDQIVDGKGRRGGPMHYRCLWGQCGQTIKRKGHALEHIQVHVGNRTFVCSVWYADLITLMLLAHILIKRQHIRSEKRAAEASTVSKGLSESEVALLELSGCVQPPRGDPFGDPRRSALGAGMFFGGRFH
ncbi:hypothetical protein FRC17_010671 [Serendipita sp. 399]|nr:hypothetical protein FRC17_010671 [Serendipita sp. 399]